MIVVPAGRLGLVHRRVGVLEQRFRIVAVLRIETDADAGGAEHLGSVELNGRLERRENPGRDPSGVLGPLDPAETDDELVAAMSRQHRFDGALNATSQGDRCRERPC